MRERDEHTASAICGRDRADALHLTGRGKSVYRPAEPEPHPARYGRHARLQDLRAHEPRRPPDRARHDLLAAREKHPAGDGLDRGARPAPPRGQPAAHLYSALGGDARSDERIHRDAARGSESRRRHPRVSRTQGAGAAGQRRG